MSDPFNRHTGLMFERTQPREWKDIPWAGEDRRPLLIALKVVGIILLWFAVAALSLWSISQSMPQPQTHARVK